MVYSAETGSIPTEQTASSAPQWEDWQARYIDLYDCFSEMAERWEKAVFDHSLEPTFGEDEYVKQNRRVLFDCRPLADFESAAEASKIQKAAPDLLHALKDLLGNAEIARHYMVRSDESAIIGSALWDTLGQAEAAIRKATL